MFARAVVILTIATIAWAGFVRSSEGAAPERTHVVQPGDTLWAIAIEHYGGDPREAVWKLQRRNGLASTLLQPGVELVLPGG